MTKSYNSKHFNTIIYTKYCYVQSFMQNKPSLRYIMRESAKKSFKTLKIEPYQVILTTNYDLKF